MADAPLPSFQEASMQPRPQTFRPILVAVVLTIMVGLVSPSFAQDDPRRPTGRERGFGSPASRRDVFDLIRAGTPADRLANLEGMGRMYEIQKAGRGDVVLSLAEKG